MLTNETRTILKSLIPINNSQIIAKETLGEDEFKTILYKLNLEALENEDFPEFGIFDMSNFLSSLDLLDNPEIFLKDNKITATDGNTELTYIISDPDLLDIEVNPKVIESTLNTNSVLEFDIGTDLFAKIKKAAGVFKTFDSLFIVKTDDSIKLKLGAKDSFNSSNNSFSINVNPSEDSSTKDYDLAIPLESILKVPAMSYTFMLKYNEERDAYRVAIQNELLTFILSLKK